MRKKKLVFLVCDHPTLLFCLGLPLQRKKNRLFALLFTFIDNFPYYLLEKSETISLAKFGGLEFLFPLPRQCRESNVGNDKQTRANVTPRNLGRFKEFSYCAKLRLIHSGKKLRYLPLVNGGHVFCRQPVKSPAVRHCSATFPRAGFGLCLAPVCGCPPKDGSNTAMRRFQESPWRRHLYSCELQIATP